MSAKNLLKVSSMNPNEKERIGYKVEWGGYHGDNKVTVHRVKILAGPIVLPEDPAASPKWLIGGSQKIWSSYEGKVDKPSGNSSSKRIDVLDRIYENYEEVKKFAQECLERERKKCHQHLQEITANYKRLTDADVNTIPKEEYTSPFSGTKA